FLESKAKANLAGFSALMLWSSSAILTAYCKGIPVFLLAAISAAVGFSIFLIKWRLGGEKIAEHFRIKKSIIALAAIGIGGSRLLYLAAFKYAPAVEANLINYLWPALIVLFSCFLPGEKVKWYHFAGGLTGFAGLVVLLGKKDGFLTGLTVGHLFALLGAIEWAAFSVVSRLAKGYSSEAIPVSFLLTGVLFMVLHFATGETGSITAGQWPYVFSLGVSAGLGYFLWDVGMKHGDIQVLAASSYLVPLASTALLIVFGKGEPSLNVAIATILIFLGLGTK
ncbi:MAG: EamA family transporter, partial [Pseudomonadota bacterium]